MSSAICPSPTDKLNTSEYFHDIEYLHECYEIILWYNRPLALRGHVTNASFKQ